MVDTDPQSKKTLAQFRIKINGSDLSAKTMGDVIGVVVDQRLHVPAMFEIRMQILPEDMTWLDDATFDVGKQVEIFVGYIGEENSLIVGNISAIEPDFDEQMPTVTIRGYDLSYKLHRSVKTRTFVDVTDSDLASTLAGEASLGNEVDTTTQAFKYLIQHGQTNYDFLLSRARRIGYEMFVEAKKLVFRKPRPLLGPPISVEWGTNLYQFRPRLSVGDQVDSVTVRGWDPKEKKAIVGKATDGKGAPENGIAKTGSNLAKETWGAAERIIIDNPVETQTEAEHLAQAELDDLAASFIEAKGACFGDPKIKAGGQLEVSKVGTKFSGKYYLTEVRHTISAETGHHTFFTACNHQPDAFSSILIEPQDRPRWPMLMIGIVTNNVDPDGMGRVKVKFPWFSDEHESHWARLVSPMAGADRGWHIFPEVNDEVLCGCEHGDPTRVFVLGALWNGKDKPPVGTKDLVAGGKVNQRIWKSRTGHLFLFDDSDGEESIRIIDKTTKNHITITSSDKKLLVEMEGDIEVTSRTGLMKLTAEKDISLESKTGTINMKADVDVVTNATTGKIAMTAMKDVTAESKSAKFGVQCVNAEVNANASAKMKANTTFDIEAGGNLTAKASAIAELNGSAMANLKGGVVNVQGSGVTNVTAPMVKIN